MWIYDQLYNAVKNFANKYPKNLVTGDEISGSIAADLTLIVCTLISCLLFRHVNTLIAAVILIVVGAILIINMPLIGKFKSEQDDSLDKMLFYAILTLGILITFIYWGGNFV